jgi:hypothetical protein
MTIREVDGSPKDEDDEPREEESSQEKLPAEPADDGSPLGDTDQHSDA